MIEYHVARQDLSGSFSGPKQNRRSCCANESDAGLCHSASKKVLFFLTNKKVLFFLTTDKKLFWVEKIID